MLCKNCGKLLSDDDKFCSNCGMPVSATPTNSKTQEVKMGLAEEDEIVFHPEPPEENAHWNTDSFPDKEPKATDELDFEWDVSDFEFRNGPSKALEELEKEEEEAAKEVLPKDNTALTNDSIQRDDQENIFLDSKQEEKPTEPVEQAAPRRPFQSESAPMYVPPKASEFAKGYDDEDITGAQLEKDLFAEMSDSNLTDAEKLRRRQTEKIDKFYTFNKKNEEFQRLLDNEYEKFKTDDHIGDELKEDMEKLGESGFYEDHSREMKNQAKAMAEARDKLFNDTLKDDGNTIAYNKEDFNLAETQKGATETSTPANETETSESKAPSQAADAIAMAAAVKEALNKEDAPATAKEPEIKKHKESLKEEIKDAEEELVEGADDFAELVVGDAEKTEKAAKNLEKELVTGMGEFADLVSDEEEDLPSVKAKMAEAEAQATTAAGLENEVKKIPRETVAEAAVRNLVEEKADAWNTFFNEDELGDGTVDKKAEKRERKRLKAEAKAAAKAEKRAKKTGENKELEELEAMNAEDALKKTEGNPEGKVEANETESKEEVSYGLVEQADADGETKTATSFGLVEETQKSGDADSKAKPEATNGGLGDGTDDGSYKGEEKKKSGKGTTVAITILCVVLAILLALGAIRIFAPYSPVSEKMDEITNKVIGIFQGSGDEMDSTNDRTKAAKDLSGIIQLEISRNGDNKIGTIKYNSTLKYEEGYYYGSDDITNSTSIDDNDWYKSGDTQYYVDQGIVGAVIDYGVKEEADLPTGSTFEELDIGDLRQGEDTYYAWISESIADAQGNITVTEKILEVELTQDGDAKVVAEYIIG